MALFPLSVCWLAAYWTASFDQDGGGGGVLQGITVDLSERTWRV